MGPFTATARVHGPTATMRFRIRDAFGPNRGLLMTHRSATLPHASWSTGWRPLQSRSARSLAREPAVLLREASAMCFAIAFEPAVAFDITVGTFFCTHCSVFSSRVHVASSYS